MPQNDESVVDALHNFLLDRFCELHTCMPGKIESFDNSTQRAEVKPLLKRALKNGTQLEYPKIANVPVIFPSAVNSGITFPLEKGDFVLLLFAEKSLDNWVVNGDDSDTVQGWYHNITDAIAIPGILPFNRSSVSTSSADLEITHKSQKIIIKANGDIELGSGSLKSLVTDELIDLFNNHTHLYVPSATPAPPAIPTTNPQVSTPPSIMGSVHLTSKVQAQ